jgi:hypothetical protein
MRTQAEAKARAPSYELLACLTYLRGPHSRPQSQGRQTRAAGQGSILKRGKIKARDGVFAASMVPLGTEASQGAGATYPINSCSFVVGSGTNMSMETRCLECDMS